MPQASDELRARMLVRFGDSTSEAGPTQFMEDAGYTLGPDWTWHKLGVDDYDAMSPEEYECLLFLAHEWDYGGLAAVVHKVDPDADMTFEKPNDKQSFGKLLMSSGLQDGDLPERDRKPWPTIDF
jgi:hypothetical protein